MQDMEDCPLVLEGVSAKLTSTGHGFAVEVTASDRGERQGDPAPNAVDAASADGAGPADRAGALWT